MSQHTLTVNGGPTVVYTLTGGRQGPPGPDLVEDRAAIEAAAAAAAADAIATAADRVQTGLDAVATAADRVQTGLDRVATGADAAATDADALATAADRVQTGLDRVATGADATATAADRVATAADRVQTGLDRTATGLDAAATAADRVQTGLDRVATAADAVATAADRIQTGTDRTTATAQAAAASASAGTATAQANLAATAAASASSVAQQDLSGVTAAALHRSPNAVVAACVYDTSKDSDGGAWVERCTNTSWFQEALNGPWRGACASEAACRAISGATTGDYFQLTTDGKFYKLNAGSGTTEVFRGNKAKPGRLGTPICEAASASLYDLTESGRPAWMRFVAAASNMIQGTIAGCAMLNGVLAVATNSGLFVINLAADTATLYNTSGRSVYRGRVSQRNAALGHDVVATGAGNVLASNTVNAVAMTVLPAAPVDPVTGLQVPTIACATAGGISVIQNDGVVRNSAATNNFASGSITRDVLAAHVSGSATFFYSLKPGALGASFALSSVVPAAAPGLNSGGAYSGVLFPVRGLLVKRGLNNSENAIGLMRFNETTPAQSLVAHIAPTYATGYWCGDIRRCWLADTVAGSVDGLSLLTGDDSTFTSGVGSWLSAANATIGAVSGELEITLAVDANSGARRTITTVVGNRYRIAATARRGTAATNAFLGVSGLGTTTVSSTSNAPASYEFTATATSHTLTYTVAAPVAGQTLYLDDITVKPVIPDRTYKAKPATIYGTLTRTAVAAAAQLVAYSGFSAANYAQEPYSSDLDTGTAAVTCSVWLNYTTAVASVFAERSAASGSRITFGTDATGKLTATAYDGTTTRTVTTSAAYNTSTWLKARASYTPDGTLSISVNGRVVASTYGTPLLTLSNASAVTTLGNDRALASAFPGSIALVKWGATVPTTEQALWMYEQEKQMFRASAQVTLPSSNSLLDVSYDDLTDTITTVDSGNEAHFSGLVRTSTATVSAGTFSKAARGSGVKMLARITTTPGVDITIPSQNLKEELLRRSEAQRNSRQPAVTIDYVGGFTGNVTNGSTAIASVTGLSVPSTVNLRGVTVTGTGIPASTVITDIVGSTVYISKAATATNTGVSISMLEFPLPTGYEAEGVATAGALKQEGSTKDFTRSFDGFTEKVVYGAAPGSTAWVQARARRQA